MKGFGIAFLVLGTLSFAYGHIANFIAGAALIIIGALMLLFSGIYRRLEWVRCYKCRKLKDPEDTQTLKNGHMICCKCYITAAKTTYAKANQKAPEYMSVRCPSCKTNLHVEKVPLGESIKCGHCNHSFLHSIINHK